MRTKPLPNRHAAENIDFSESIQATLNKNRDKQPLDSLSLIWLCMKLFEEVGELVWEIGFQALRRLFGRSVSYPRIEAECRDVAVVCLGLWMYARRNGRKR